MVDKRRKAARSPVKARKVVAKAVIGTGPLTLEQAQAVALANRPALAAKSAAKAAAPQTSPATVGAERKELKKKQKIEIARRLQEYSVVMRLLKKRGVRAKAARTASKKGTSKNAAKPASFVPLQVFAEGDSWFDYPVPLFGGGIIPRLQSKLGVPILNLASAGDEARYMLGVEQRKNLIKHLKNGCPAGGPWDLLLFSGGGNDIVGEPLALWIRHWDPTKSPQQHLVQKRFDAALTLVRAAYEDVISLRDQLSANTHIVFHAYDYAIPDGRGICHLGPWLKPAFDLNKFPTQASAHQVVKLMIDQFATMIDGLAQTSSKVTFIRTPGTLVPSPSSWHNELHPSKDGFKIFTGLFREQIKLLFPNKVS